MLPSPVAVDDCIPRRHLWDILSYPAAHLVTIFMEIMVGKLTGSLTINFSNGTPAGSIEWKQRLPLDIFPPSV